MYVSLVLPRTPIGGFLGALSPFSATKLGYVVIQCALRRANVDPSLVQEVFFGNVLSANLGQAPARQAALGAGIPNSVICTTINEVSASGMKGFDQVLRATMFAAQSTQLGINDIVVAGGMESMPNAPKYLADARKGSRFEHDSIIDGMLKDGLWDVYNDFAMEFVLNFVWINTQFLDKSSPHTKRRMQHYDAGATLASEALMTEAHLVEH